jgi:hypothetical protein
MTRAGTFPIRNCTLYKISLQGNDFVGISENIRDCDTKEINPVFSYAVTGQERIAHSQLSPLKQKWSA